MSNRQQIFKSGDIVRYPNKGYDYRVVECLGWNANEGDYVYEIVFDKPFSEAGKRFRASEVERALVHKSNWKK